MAGGPIDLPLVREVLHDLIQTIATPKRLDEIEAALIHVLKIDADSLRGKNRDRRQSVQRILACYLARRHTSASASEIGGYFGGKSHSTVLAAERKVTSWLNSSTSNANTPPELKFWFQDWKPNFNQDPGRRKCSCEGGLLTGPPLHSGLMFFIEIRGSFTFVE